MVFRPARFVTELLQYGERRLRALIWTVLLGWLAFLAVAAGAMSLVAYGLDAPSWAYLIVAAVVVVLVAPVVFAALVALAGIRTWVGRAEDAARVEAAVLENDAAPPADPAWRGGP